MHSGKEVLITNRIMTTRKRTIDTTAIKRCILTCKQSLLTISNKYVNRVWWSHDNTTALKLHGTHQTQHQTWFSKHQLKDHILLQIRKTFCCRFYYLICSAATSNFSSTLLFLGRRRSMRVCPALLKPGEVGNRLFRWIFRLAIISYDRTKAISLSPFSWAATSTSTSDKACGVQGDGGLRAPLTSVASVWEINPTRYYKHTCCCHLLHLLYSCRATGTMSRVSQGIHVVVIMRDLQHNFAKPERFFCRSWPIWHWLRTCTKKSKYLEQFQYSLLWYRV